MDRVADWFMWVAFVVCSVVARLLLGPEMGE